MSRFLLIFSFLILAAVGVIWACADMDESEYSVFTPELFVNKQYSPFFYTGYAVYYGIGYAESSNSQYNEIITNEWYDYFKQQFGKSSLRFLLTTASQGAIDSVYSNFKGESTTLPITYADSAQGNPDKKQKAAFFKYLILAKACETYTVNSDYTWYDSVKKLHAPVNLESQLSHAFTNENDSFIKERLWFQLVRYYYFSANSSASAKMVDLFDKYQVIFPKNLIYYRTLAYVAGYYYHNKDYARSNYLYSLCYNYSSALKIPSFWSFHPQNESDWSATLKMARNNEEKATLWQMLGIAYDEGRAIKEIAAFDLGSEKMDLLLSRLINIREAGLPNPVVPDSARRMYAEYSALVSAIASKNKTARPYYWNLAAGYLNYLDSNYTAAGRFYRMAKKQFPAGDTLLVAQGKLLDVLLQVKKLNHIDPLAEGQLVEPLNWLADMRDRNSSTQPANLRFMDAVNTCSATVASVYKKQNDLIKAVCFGVDGNFYSSKIRVDQLIAFLLKPNKSPFEKVMMRYYPLKVNDLYYHQAIVQAYNDNISKAISYMENRDAKDSVLEGNPFNSRIVDCHDCDHAAHQKRTFTPLSFLQTLQKMKTDVLHGKDVYKNEYLIASACYNMSYYGNGRTFYQNDVVTDSADNDLFTSMDLATKYYLLARKSATTNEQKARCAFMLSKCAQNDTYPNPINYDEQTTATYRRTDTIGIQKPFKLYLKYFAELKTKYRNTAYYKEVLRECGYFRNYSKGK